MPIPTPTRTTRAGRPLAAGAVALMIALAACSGSVAPTAAPSLAVTPPAPTAVPTASASVAPPSASPASTAPASPTPSLPALALLWQKGGSAPTRAWTFQPAIDPVSGDIWVAVSFDNVYWIFAPDGRYLESWGTPGKGKGQFHLSTHEQDPSPFGTLAFAPDGSFYVADIGNNRIEKFDKDRHFVLSFGGFGHADGKFTRAWDVRTDGKTVYVGDDDQNNILAFDTDGHWLRTFPWSDAFFALDPEGRIVSLTGTPEQADAIVVLDPMTGQQVKTFPFPRIAGQALGFAVDSAGHIFVTMAQPDDAPHVPVATIELDKDGKTIGTWSTAGETIAVAPDGKAIYLAADWAYIRKYALPTP